MERLVGKVLNIVDGGTIEVEIAPLPPRLELTTDGLSAPAPLPATPRLPRIEKVRLAGRGLLAQGSIENELAEIALHSRLFLKRVELEVVSRERDEVVCEVRRVG